MDLAIVIFRTDLQCKSFVFLESLLAPAFHSADGGCWLQSQPLLFSCRAAGPGVQRLCPCRSYRKEQVALCQSCWSVWGSAARAFLFLISFVTGLEVDKAGKTKIRRLGLCVDLTNRRRVVRGENENGMRILCPAEAAILWVIIETAAPYQTWRMRNCS